MLYNCCMDAATAQTRIDEIETILTRGIEEITTPSGRRHRYNFAELRLERDKLQAYLNRGSRGRNVRVGRYNPHYPDA